MSAPTVAELRRSYWWACRFLDSMYNPFSSDLAAVSEYPTRTPFSQIYYKDHYVEGFMPIHQMGNGVISAFGECAFPVIWFTFSKIHNDWNYVHNATRDYTVIARIGFEDTEISPVVVTPSGVHQDTWWGDPYYIANQDCNEPTILVEYTRNRLKNGFFTFRQWGTLLPAFWTVYPLPFPENMYAGLSTDAYVGPYSLKVWYKGDKTLRFIEAYTDTEILPDTEYVLSMYYKGQINYYSVCFWISFYDINGNLISYVRKYLDYGNYAKWQDAELRFRTPANAYTATVHLQVDASPEPWPYSEATAYFDAFWLSECPINLKPHYSLRAQLETYEGERRADIFFNGELIWQNVSANTLPQNIFETQISLDGIPSFRSAIRHSVQNNVFYYKYTSMHPEWQDRANKLQAFRDKFGYTYDIYHVLWRESDTYPDDFMVRWESVHDCDAWYHFVFERYHTFYPYWSKMCQCRFASDSPLCGYLLATWFGSILGMHPLNKYNDPYREISLVSACFPGPVIVSARKVAHDLIPTLTWNKGVNVNWPASPPIYAPFANACCLAFLAEIGYGFKEALEARGEGDLAASARSWADNLASALLKQQWGYPFTAGKPGFYKHESYGDMNIPEFAGGFCTLVVYDGETPMATSRKEWFAQLADILSMPMETPGVIAVNQESTFTALRALQIYEWYKYKGGKGAFPKLLMPADVDGDGWVSQLDVAKVKFCIDNKIYDPLCDINADGRIDEEDLNLVKAHLDRGTPRKGTIWTPTLSPTTQVGVYVRM